MRNIFTKMSTLILLTTFGWLLNQNVALGQTASQYGFTAVGGTYTAITGGTAVTTVNSDDNTSAAINIGFNFTYCGIVYTQIKANANCWITFNPAVTSNTWTNSTTDLNTIKPALMPFFDDVAGWVTGANASNATYLVTGTSPNRVFTFQYQNWQFPRLSTTSPPTYNCQVKLYETTNVIEFVYDRIPPVTTGTSGVTIGIGDAQGTPTFLTLSNSGAAPTVSSTVFNTNINDLPAAGQIYRFTPPVNCSLATGWPASATTTVTPSTICVSQNVTLTYTPITALPPTVGLSYQWQSATAAGGPWTNVAVSTTPTYTTTVPVSTPLFFRCQLMCNTSSVIMTSSNSAQVVINNPGTPTTVPGARCGPGTVNLTATPGAGTTIRWFNNLTQTIPISTNNTYSTPYLTQNTTYYAASVSGGTNNVYNVGLANFIQNNPFITNSAGWGVNFTVTSTCNVDSVAVYPIGTGTIQMRIWNATTQAVVYTGPVSPSMTGTGTTKTMVFVGANALPPGNYVMGIAAFTGLTNLHNEGFNASAYPFTCPVLNITSGSQGFSSTPNVYYFSYDWRVSAIGGCEGPRVPVVATINSSPVVAKTFPAVVCNNNVAAITLTPPSPPYASYTWTPTTNLYTNAAATTPYTGGSATSLYMKTNTVGPQVYYMMAGDPTVPTGCTFADTTQIWVQPTGIAITGAPDTICTTGSTTLKLNPLAGYAPGSIVWQNSSDNVTYGNITGATTSTYTTPVLNYGQNTYYKALINAGANVCEAPVKYVVIANPTLLSTRDSFNCGPGSVVLTAVTGGNGSAIWYDSPSSTTPIGSGSPFITPSLSASTNYYVVSGVGGNTIPPVLGAGALTSGTQTYNPFCAGWGGTKVQYLIRASELSAAGITSTTFAALGMDVVTGGTLYPGFAISMKNTTSTVVTGTNFEGSVPAPVFPATNVTPTANALNMFTFATPFQWDGTSNILIQMCWSNGTTNSVGNTVKGDNTTFVSSHRGQTDSQTPTAMCGLTTTSLDATYSTRPKFTFKFKPCESPRQLVHAYIYPKPAVDLGADINMCVDHDAALVLDAGVQPNTPAFLWDNGNTSQVRAVTETGTYNVKVTNMYTCVGSDTINVLLRRNPVVHLGNDTTVCNGVVLALNSGNDGINYFWNTGQTGQVIDVDAAGTYSVFVTNSQGCTTTDTITVSMQGELPTIQGIQVSNNGQRRFHFTAVYPQNVVGYEWDFGDGSLPSYEMSPTHEYDSIGDFIVVLHLSSTCGFANDTISAHIVGINQITVNNDELMVYPNPSNGRATILNKGDLKMQKVEVYNVLGQVVYRSKADSKDKHVIDLSAMASGVYTVEVYTDKGTVARKLEILR